MVMPTFLGAVSVLLGLLVLWRTLVNANNMNRATRHGIRLLNLVLFGAAVALIAAPFVSLEATLMALQAALGAFVVCMFLGRRPTDRVLGG